MLKPATVFSTSASATTSATLAATMTADANSFWYVSGFTIAIAGATAGSIVNATLTGLAGGTITIPIAVPGTATTGAFINVEYITALAAASISTGPALNLPAVGAGNTSAAISLRGFKGDRSL